MTSFHIGYFGDFLAQKNKEKEDYLAVKRKYWLVLRSRHIRLRSSAVPRGLCLYYFMYFWTLDLL